MSEPPKPVCRHSLDRNADPIYYVHMPSAATRNTGSPSSGAGCAKAGSQLEIPEDHSNLERLAALARLGALYPAALRIGA
jgi:hypothetical protein